MEREQIKEVMRDVFGRNVYLRDLGVWVGSHCPLARWTHETGQDSSPSAGVLVADNGTSIFNCFTCGNTAPLHVMLERYSEFSGEDLEDLIEELREGEFLGPRNITGWDARIAANGQEVLMPIDESLYMDLYEPAEGHPYLKSRGISKATTRKLELRFDPKDSEKEPRILFPVRGTDGLLYGFSGRAIRDKARIKVRDYHGLAKAHLVLGAHLATSSREVVVVEGLFDYAAGHECGHSACAVMHSSLTEHQAAILKEIGARTYLFYDNDKAGQKGVEEALRQLDGHLPLFTSTYPRVKIEDDSSKGWHWLKDIGEIMPEELSDMLARAVLYAPIRRRSRF